MKESHIYYLRKAIQVSERSRQQGNTPFGAILVDPEGNIIEEQENVEITEHRCTGHAETMLAEKASIKYSKEFLWNCTIYTTVEPCAMCTGAIYWGNIGTIVYGLEESTLLKMTGDNEQNPTLDIPCRNILAKGQKAIQVYGPFPELAATVAEVHESYWNNI